MRNSLLKIGEMAELSHVSTQTLRLYAKNKLLEPEYMDPETMCKAGSDPCFEKLPPFSGTDKRNIIIIVRRAFDAGSGRTDRCTD